MISLHNTYRRIAVLVASTVIATALLAIAPLKSTATPTGPTLIPGATQVDLSSYYNRTGFVTDGQRFVTGFDGNAAAYSATLLGTSVYWNNLVFNFGPSNTPDVVACEGQTITLPPGRFNTLEILGAGVGGNQPQQTFIVTYTDNSTATFTQDVSDWADPQSYVAEFTVMTMPYRNRNDGGREQLNVSVYGYVLVLDQTRTVESISVPYNANINLMAMILANNDADVALAPWYNRPGIYTDSTPFNNPATGGLDGNGDAYSATLTGNSLTGTNTLFAFGPFDTTNVICCTGQTITLPPGNYAQCQILATAVGGAQASQHFTIKYANFTKTTLVRSLSDWLAPTNFSGESRALTMSYRNVADGTADNRTVYLYGYSLKLDPSEIVQSLQLPNDTNVIVAAISLVPEWQPTFGVNPLTLPGAYAGEPYSANVATNASDLNGDPITFALVSGPSWLTVASNGALSGTPANANAGTNMFLISATDTGGLSSTNTVYIYVTPGPFFNLNPFTMASVVVGENYSGTIATNATDPNTGELPVFSIVSGPSWLSVEPNGTLFGTPRLANVGTNTFTVSVTGYYDDLTSTGTMYILVVAPILQKFSSQSGNLTLTLTWSGGFAPYQLQMTTNLSNPIWQNVGSLTSGTNVLITPSNSAAFYRVVGH